MTQTQSCVLRSFLVLIQMYVTSHMSALYQDNVAFYLSEVGDLHATIKDQGQVQLSCFKRCAPLPFKLATLQVYFLNCLKQLQCNSCGVLAIYLAYVYIAQYVAQHTH